jgi:hypothetical protein
MSWATGKRLMILGVIALILLSIAGVAAYFTLHKAPSCIDNIENQGEEGIDCGGPCSRLCSALEKDPIVSYARPVQSGTRTDVVAYIQNPNSAAVKSAKYVVELYDANRALIGSATGFVDLAPRESVPLFVEGIYTGTKSVGQAFVSFDAASLQWMRYAGTRVLPRGGQISVGGTTNAPRITASVSNAAAVPLRNIPVVVVVHDAQGVIIAASRTIIPQIPARGSADATFTWNQPFSGTLGPIDIFPVLPL